VKLGRFPLLSAVAAAACTGEAATPQAAEIADSAGVRVVINPAPESAPVWRVAELPEVEIGMPAVGRPASVVDLGYVLYQVTGAASLSDGTIVVANRGTLELRYYTPQGQLLARAGGRGDGPGEFADLSLVGVLPNDSIVVNDVRHRVISVYDARGHLVRTRRLASEFGDFPAPVGILDDGSLFLSPTPLELAEGEFRELGGNLRTTNRVIVAGPDGMERGFSATFRGARPNASPTSTAGCFARRAASSSSGAPSSGPPPTTGSRSPPRTRSASGSSTAAARRSTSCASAASR
jgi:hypothetical protein